ncbi:hypothetical protein [Fibrella aquatilis]|uniref:Uncharacterized protein n=1 Tax=Fibrella aquatilis TaxID=2817059 RepID=A0A939G0C7_9BACT|nr:hypothetical protein [Fibrella aquatilis]MBO0930057.1 hypothetical protein [Fibrella aquatilis]
MNRMPRFMLPAVLFGVALVVFFHFFVKLALFALIVGGAVRFIRSRMFGGSTGSMGRDGWQNRRLEFTDKIRNMSDEEYAAFKQPRWLNNRNQTDESFGRHSEHFVL